MSNTTYDGLDFVAEETSIGDLGASAVAPVIEPAVVPVVVSVVADPVTKAFKEIPKLVTRIAKFKSMKGTLSKLVCAEAKRRRKIARIIASLEHKLHNLERMLRGDRQIKAPTPRYDPRFQDRDGQGLNYVIQSAVDRAAARKRKAAENKAIDARIAAEKRDRR